MNASEPYRVLFVCLGNICRSPAAEIIFKKMVKEQGLENLIESDSAGMIGYHRGCPPDRRMLAALENTTTAIRESNHAPCGRMIWNSSTWLWEWTGRICGI